MISPKKSPMKAKMAEQKSNYTCDSLRESDGRKKSEDCVTDEAYCEMKTELTYVKTVLKMEKSLNSMTLTAIRQNNKKIIDT
jgi:hypothetical protein